MTKEPRAADVDSVTDNEVAVAALEDVEDPADLLVGATDVADPRRNGSL